MLLTGQIKVVNFMLLIIIVNFKYLKDFFQQFSKPKDLRKSNLKILKFFIYAGSNFFYQLLKNNY